MRSVVALLLLSLAPFPALCQRRTDAQIRDALRGYDSTEAQRAALLRGFGMEADEAKSYAFDDNDTNPIKVEWIALRPVAGARARALFLPCRDFMFGARVLFLTEVDGAWKKQSEQGFDCHYDFDVSLQVIQITSATQFDLLVQHGCIGHGTGYVEQQAYLFRIVDGKLKLAWHDDDTLKNFGWSGAPSELKKSTLLLTSPGVLEETRETFRLNEDGETIPGPLRVERRTFRWSTKDEKLISSMFRRLR